MDWRVLACTFDIAETFLIRTTGERLCDSLINRRFHDDSWAMLKKLKRTLLASSKQLGAFRILRHSAWRRSHLLVIGYHGVAIDDEHRWNPSLYVTPGILEQRFRTLRDGGYNVLALDDAVIRLASGTLPPKSVVLTFDDGFADFALAAFPLLERFGFPATVYLTTYYSRFNRPVFGVFCSYVLWKSRRENVRSTDLVPDAPAGIWNLREPADRQAAHRAITEHAERNGLSGAAKDDLARHVARAVGMDYDDLVRRRILCLLTPQEVTDLSDKGVDFQLHTHRHRTPVDRTLFLREIEDNRAALQQMTGRTGTHFCYPSGVYEPEFLGWLREAGVRSATTCDTGISDASMDPLLLPRLIDTMNLAPIEFESWLTGAGAFLPLRPHRPTHG